jgi:hypothetical protein
MQCSLAEVAAMNLVPGVPFAVARLTQQAAAIPPDTPAPAPAEPTEDRGGALAQWVAMRCNEEEFWRFLGKLGHAVTNGKEAAEAVRRICNVQSRKEFDTDPAAEQRFHERIRIPFGRFLRGQNVP